MLDTENFRNEFDPCWWTYAALCTKDGPDLAADEENNTLKSLKGEAGLEVKQEDTLEALPFKQERGKFVQTGRNTNNHLVILRDHDEDGLELLFEVYYYWGFEVGVTIGLELLFEVGILLLGIWSWFEGWLIEVHG